MIDLKVSCIRAWILSIFRTEIIEPGRRTMILPNYEIGLQKLHEKLQACNSNAYREYLVLEARLLENLRDDLRYGSTSDLQARRAMIIDQMNRLCLEHLDGVTFNDLCKVEVKSSIRANGIKSHFPQMQNGDVYINRFTIKGFIGRGGFSDAYLAWDRIKDCEVVIKLFSTEKQPEFLQQYVERETKMAYLLSTKIPGLVGTHEVIRFSNGVCFVQESIPGESLHNRITAKGLVKTDEAIATTIKLCNTLELLHSRKIAHCDVKPLNIIIRSPNDPVLIDLGAARYFDEQLKPEQIVISIPYSAPELKTGERVDSRADIYSLGITLLHMLAGLPQWEKSCTIDFDTAPLPVIVLSNAPKDDEIRNHILRCLWLVETDRLRSVLQKAIAEKPQERYSEMKELRDDLERYTTNGYRQS